MYTFIFYVVVMLVLLFLIELKDKEAVDSNFVIPSIVLVVSVSLLTISIIQLVLFISKNYTKVEISRVEIFKNKQSKFVVIDKENSNFYNDVYYKLKKDSDYTIQSDIQVKEDTTLKDKAYLVEYQIIPNKFKNWVFPYMKTIYIIYIPKNTKKYIHDTKKCGCKN